MVSSTSTNSSTNRALTPAGDAAAARPVRARLVYILSASHSGSTLLALLLGSHRDLCTVGELKATSLGSPERYLCSCGERIRACAFWREVSRRMAERGMPFDITHAGTDFQHGAGRLADRLLRPLHRGASMELIRDAALACCPSWRRNRPEIGLRNRLLVETLCELTGAAAAVDSSKIGLRLKYLLKIPQLDIKVVRLIRDGRAVACTYTNPHELADASDPRLRGGGGGTTGVEASRPIAEGAHEWRRSNEEAECVLARLAPEQWTQVHYEQLCALPRETMERLFRFLDLDPTNREPDFRARSRHVIGNGMRMDATREIQCDERWRTVLTERDLKEFERVAGDMNRRYGYR